MPEHVDLIFDGWPSFQMKITGRDWHGTVPTRVMGPLLEVQKDLYRAYASVCYGTDNLRHLGAEDRDKLELIVRVREGSSDYEAPIDEKLTELAKTAIGKMTSRDLALTIAGIALVMGGVEVSKAWIASRQEAKQADQTVALSQQETERMKVFAEAVKQQPLLAEVKADHDASQNRLLKAIKPTDTVVLQGTLLQGSEAAEIVQSERGRSEDVEVGGVFRVLSNDASKSAGFRIKIQRITDGLTFSAEVPVEIPESEKRILQQAEWSKGAKLVRLSITASELRGHISNAVVYQVKRVR